MKQNRLFKTLFVLTIMFLCSVRMLAQEPYAVLSDNNTVLKFYYDEGKANRNGMDVGPFDSYYGMGWYQQRENITTVVFDASFANCTTLTSTAYWFYGCKNLTTITDISNLNTDNVTNMSYMFCNCSSLTSFDVSNFNTSNVTEMNFMFNNCKALTNLDLSNFNTSNVTSMWGMFSGCSGLTALDLSNFNTSNVTSMSGIFQGCFGLTSLDVSNFNTSNVTDMSGMFQSCSGLTSLDVSNFNTSNVTNMRSMFYGCSGLTTLDVSNLNTSNVTAMFGMFTLCSGLTSLDLSSFNTSNVTEMNSMFSGCSGLTTLNVSNFNTTNVTYMSGMFQNCSGLTSLDLSGFNTANVTHIDWMFRGCSGLTSLELSNFDTSNAVDMSEMFNNCSGLTSLDLSSFNTSNVKYDANNYIYGIQSMFYGCSALTTIWVGDNWTTANLTESADVFTDCAALVGGAGTHFNPDHVDYTYARIDGGPNSQMPGYFTHVGDQPWVDPVAGDAEPYAVLSDNNTVLTFYYDDKKAERNGMSVGPFTATYDQLRTNISSGWDENRENIIAVVFDTSFADCSSITSTAYWFYGFNKLSTIIGINNLKTTNVTNMESMFYGCSGLTSLDLSSFNTANVTNMSWMFNNCEALTNLDVSNFNTSNVTNMGEMFNNCSGLTSLDVSNFNTEKVTNMHAMFSGCISLTSLDVSYFKTGNVTEMNHMFNSCVSLTSLDVSNFKIDNVTSMYWMFSGCEGLTSLDVSNFKTDNVTNMQFMFNGCSGLTSLDVSNFNTANVTDMVGMFEGCSGLTTLDVSNFNTSNVTVMIEMFSGCSGLTTLDLSNFNTSNVKYMYKMFSGCPALTTIYASDKWSTASVTKGNDMFTDCINLVGGAGTHFNPDHVDYTYARIDGGLNSQMPGYFTYKDAPVVGDAEPYAVLSDNNTVLTFYYDEKKAERNGMSVGPFDNYYSGEHSEWYDYSENINFVFFDASFANCSSLTSTASWFATCRNLYNITGIENLKTDNVTNMGSMFSGCYSLTSLDVSNFKTDNVTNMNSMFGGCSSLTSLDLNKFKTDNVTDMNGMFFGCSSLTNLDLSNFKTDNVTNMNSMFSGCSALTSLNVSNFKTDNVTVMGSMFSSCSNLTSLDVTGFNTQNVTDMSGMFSKCSGLTSLDVSGFKTDNVTNMDGMFKGCSGLTSLDVSGFKTNKVTVMEGMFRNCGSLTSLDLSSFNTAQVMQMSGMFRECTGLTTLNLSGFNTSHVTVMEYMFNSCTNMTTLDLSSFNTAKVEDMDGMFSDCSALTTVYVGNGWSTAAVTHGNNMFNSCTSLVGGAGTVYDVNHIDYTYARIDGGPNSQMPGYFTYKNAPVEDLTARKESLLKQIQECRQMLSYLETLIVNAKVNSDSDKAKVADFMAMADNIAAKTYDVEKRIYDAQTNDELDVCEKDIHVLKAALQELEVAIMNYHPTEVAENRMLALWRQVDGKDYKLYTIIDRNDYRTNADGTVFNRTKIVLDIISDNDKTSVVVDPGEVYTQQRPYDSWMMPSMLIDKTNNRMYVFTHSKAQEMYYRMDGYCYVSSLSTPAFTKEEVFGDNTPDYTNWGWSNYFVGVNDSGQPVLSFFSYSGYYDYLSTRMEDGTWQNVNLGNIMPDEASARWQTVNKVTVVGGTEGDEATLGNITYTLRDDRNAAVSWVDDKDSMTEFTVPETITVDGKTLGVTEIAPLAFAECRNLRLLTIPTSVTRVGEGAMIRCNSLEHVYVGNATPPAMVNDYDSELIQFYGANTDNCTLHVPAHSADRYRNATGWRLFHNIEEEVIPEEPYAVLSENNTVIELPYGLGNSTGLTLTFYYDEKKSERNGLDIGPFGYDNVRWGGEESAIRITQVVFDESFANYKELTSMDYWFSGFMNLTSFVGMNNLNTDNVRSMAWTFGNCSKLTSIDLSHFNTESLTWARCIFQNCSGLTTLDLSNFNTDLVTDMCGLFDGCSGLTHLNVSHFNTENVEDVRSMFSGCTGLTSLDLGNFKLDKVERPSAMLSNCTSLASIVWGTGLPLSADMLEGTDNPNLLVYVNEARLAPEGIQNVVVNGVAQEIVLTDVTDGNGNFFCPQEFQAEKISYTREFSQQTRIGVSRGWESIALPFTVQSITHEERGTIAPFGSDASDLHFWLRRLNPNGLSSVQTIEANTPYIISMPNSWQYPDRYNLSGRVTFSAANATVPVSMPVIDESHDYAMVPTFLRMGVQEDVYVLNVGEKRDFYPEGSVFERNYRVLRPFEAYTLHKGNTPAPQFFVIDDYLDGNTTEIEAVQSSQFTVHSEAEWYTLDGRKLQKAPTAKGVYIYNGKKIIVE